MAIALIRKFYEHVSRGEFGDALALFAEHAQIAFVGPDVIPLVGTYRGRREIERFFGVIGNTVDVEVFQPLEFIDGGAHVIVIGRERSVVRATRRTFDVGWVQVWTVEDGRIVRLRDYFDTGSMLPAFA